MIEKEWGNELHQDRKERGWMIVKRKGHIEMMMWFKRRKQKKVMS